MARRFMFAAALAALFVGGISTGAGGSPTSISRICSTVTRTVTTTTTSTVTTISTVIATVTQTVTTASPATTTAGTTTTGTTTAPAPSASGSHAVAFPDLGLVQYGGSLVGTTHISDVGVVIGDFSDAPLLATLPGLSFAYTSLTPVDGSSASTVYDPTSPSRWVADVQKLFAANPGLDGIFVDNVSASSSANLSFVRTVAPQIGALSKKLMLNAEAFGAPAYGNGDDGTADVAWFAALANAAPGVYLMSEYWMEGRGGPLVGRIRYRGSADYACYWDGWEKLPAAAHANGGHFVGLTYGPDDTLVYGRASELPVAQPGDIFIGHGSGDSWSPAWTVEPGHPSIDPVAGSASLG
jgi:hypothetical protein